jgi:hypothetical protein
MNWAAIPGSGMVVSVEGPAPGQVYDNNWSSRYASDDGRNTIEFISSGWPGFWGPNIIAMTIPRLDGAGRIKEADIFCNAQDFKWVVFGAEGYFPGLEPANYIDAEALITHEMGHVLGLGHSQFSWACMYWLPGVADTRDRRLTSDDRHGLLSLYAATGEAVPPASPWGIYAGTYGGDCGLGSLDITSAQYAYVYKTAPLAGPHELLLNPPLPGGTDFPFCIFGAGFSAAFFQGLDLFQDGAALGAVSGSALVSSNFVKAEVLHGAGGRPLLATGSYDVAVIQDPGGAGLLDQGIFVNTLANQLPEAVIQPARDMTAPGVWVALDGSGSIDADGDPLAFKWSVAEKPVGSVATLSSDTAAQTAVILSAPGLYLVRLVVNDGISDSISDQVLLRASYTLGHDDESETGPFGCMVSSAHSGFSSLIFILVPIALALAVRRIRTRGTF